MESADGRKSKVNPSLTKEDVFNIHMGCLMKGDITRVKSIAIKHLVKEFGSYYE